MSDQYPNPTGEPPPAQQQPTDPSGYPPPSPPANPPGYGAAPAYAAPAPGSGEIGKVRGTFITILLMLVTFGIYQLVYFYKVHDEMKRHTGRGMGGGIALVLALFVGIVLPYLTSAEVGDMRARAGQEKRVSAMTGLWYFPGIFIIIGPLIGFVKMNGALNDYWESQGATR